MMRPRALGIHIYSGAFTLGVTEHFDIAAQLEEGPWGAATFKLNFPNTPHYLNFPQWPMSSLEDTVQFVYANPPCAPWSPTGSHLGVGDPRLAYTRNVVSAALALQPEVFILESVPRAWSEKMGGRGFYTDIVDAFFSLDYQVTVYFTNALLVGGTQHRDRFHLIAHRNELNISTPTMARDEIPTVRSLIRDLEIWARSMGREPIVPNHVVRDPTKKELAVIHELRQGEGWNKAADRVEAAGGVRCRGRIISGRAIYDAPSRTVVDVGAIVHPTENRFITLREGARLCGYPDSFIFALHGRAKAMHDALSTDVTQAVMPQVGAYLARLARASLDARPAQPGELEIIDHRPLARSFSPGRWFKGIQGETPS